MKAIIHIGAEKTGTTTIQEFLNLNRKTLAKNGIAYLKSPGVKNSRKLATYCMNDDLTDDQVKSLGIVSKTKRSKWKDHFKKVFHRELSKLSPAIHSVILSSEHFHSRLRTEDDIRRLYDLLSPFFDEIVILAYLRRQDQVAVSHYSTLCRNGLNNKRNILEMNPVQDHHYYNYYDLLHRWAKIFGKEKTKARIYDKEKLHTGDLLNDFMQWTGITNELSIIIPENKNEKLSSTVQDVLIVFNKFFPRFINNRPNHIANELRLLLIEQLAGRYKGDEKLPIRHDAEQFYGQFTDSNKKLADYLFSGEPVFSEDFSRYPEIVEPESLNQKLLSDVFLVFSKFLKRKYFSMSLASIFSVLKKSQKVTAKLRQRLKKNT